MSRNNCSPSAERSSGACLQVDGGGTCAEHDVVANDAAIPERLDRVLPAFHRCDLIQEQQRLGRAAESPRTTHRSCELRHRLVVKGEQVRILCSPRSIPPSRVEGYPLCGTRPPNTVVRSVSAGGGEPTTPRDVIVLGTTLLGIMVLDAQELADALAEEPESMYVRLAARWLTHGDPASPAPALTRNRVADALVAATVALKAQRESVPTPAWTNEPERQLDRLWHPSPPQLFGWSLAHAPAELKARGIIVEADSLVSV